jgi:hypothetical protein
MTQQDLSSPEAILAILRQHSTPGMWAETTCWMGGRVRRQIKTPVAMLQCPVCFVIEVLGGPVGGVAFCSTTEAYLGRPLTADEYDAATAIVEAADGDNPNTPYHRELREACGL